MRELFDQFLKERRLLKNISPKTEQYYRQALIAFERYSGESLDSLSSGKLNKWTVAMLETGVRPVSCNTYISAMNAFFNWCAENDVTPKRFKAGILKIEEKGFKTLSENQLLQIAYYKPETPSEWRTHTITSLLIDTGARIEEVLGLLTVNVNFEDALITIKGKGGKTGLSLSRLR